MKFKSCFALGVLAFVIPLAGCSWYGGEETHALYEAVFDMWGLSFRPEAFLSKGIFFDEHLGMPNYLYNGEDSVFLFDLCKKSEKVYLSSFYICEVKETKKSTWFEQFDKRYFVTKGYVYTHLYGINWPFALARMYLKYHKDYKMKYPLVRKYAALGHAMYKEHFYEEP